MTGDVTTQIRLAYVHTEHRGLFAQGQDLSKLNRDLSFLSNATLPDIFTLS